ncbi:MAG TPA: DUF3795 domain-containing protein [Bacillota bacterium]|nr:DUF3795 domain-containing protein [Bacillota bacterium]
MDDQVLGYCGLFCGGCRIYQQTQKGIATKIDDNLTVTCQGCNSNQLTPWCTDCGIKNCSRAKGMRYCLECGEFPCEPITHFMDDPQYPYHREVLENMRRLKEVGLEQWLAEMGDEYSCPSCRQQTHWLEQACSTCGKELKNGRSV